MPYDNPESNFLRGEATSTSSESPSRSNLLAEMKAAARLLVSPSRKVGAKILLSAMMAAAAVLCTPRLDAQSQLVVTTVTGTVSSGEDISGVFGPPNTNLAGLPYTATYIFNPNEGTQTFVNCPGSGSSEIISTSTSNPGTAVLRIETGSYTFGTLSPPLANSFQSHSVSPSNMLLGVEDVNGGNTDSIFGTITPAPGTVLTTNCLWYAPFTNSQLDPTNLTNFFISYNGAIAEGSLSPSTVTEINISVDPKTNGYCPQCVAGAVSSFLSGPISGADPKPGLVSSGEPITLGTGNVFELAEDYRTTGQNPLGFTRYYNSFGNSAYPNTYATTLGVNWRSNFDRYLNISGSTVNAERADGQVVTFTLSGSNWTTDSDVDLKLTNVGTTWTLTDHNDNVETYTASGSKATLNSIAARNGYTQTMHYAGNLLSSVSDSYNRTLSFTYTGGLLQTLSTPDNLTFTYGFTSVTGGNVLTTVGYSTAPATNITYQYGNSSFPLALTGLIDENGQQFSSWTYDTLGRGQTSQRGGIGADLTTITYNSNGTTTSTNAFGVADTYTFSLLQGIPKVTQISRAATSTTAAATRNLGYDANGYVNSSTDWDGNLTTYVNNAQGNPTTINFAVGTPQAFSVTISYDPTFTHLPHQIVTPGLTSVFAYDSSGELLSRTDTDTTTQNVPYSTNGQQEFSSFTWSNFLLASGKAFRNGTVLSNELTTYGYDSTGALTSVTDALNHVTQITAHTGGGLPQTVIDPNNITTTLAYDARLQLTSSTLHTTGGNLVTVFGRDAAEQLTSLQLPDNSKLTFGYDAAHRLTGATDLFNNSIVLTLDALGGPTLINVKNPGGTVTRTHSAVFDALDRITSDIGGMGQTTSFTYDPNGYNLTITPPAPSGEITQTFDALNRLATRTDPAPGGTTTIGYDAHNRVTSVQDANNNTTGYVYDGFGNRIQIASPDSGTTVNRFDADNNLTQVVKAGSLTANYGYDNLNRISTVSYPSDSTLNVAATYDQTSGHGFGVGRLTSATDQAGSLNLTYDERGNVTAESRVVTGVGTLNTATTYDAASNISSIAYPSSTLVTYTRDSMGRVTGVTAKPPGAPSPSNIATGVTYEPFGPETGLTFGNGITGSYGYDLDYRATTRTATGTSTVQNLSYGYYANDSVQTITDAVNPLNSQTMNYDTLDRLTSAVSGSGGYGTYGFTWDKVTNIATQTVNGTPTTYSLTPGSNRLASFITGGTTTTVDSTPAGNIADFKISGTAITTLTYNQADQLATAATTSSSASYKYDLAGGRLEKAPATSNPILYQYGQAARELLSENDLHSGTTADYVYLNGKPIGEVNPTNGKLYFTHTDRLGTPDTLTDSTKAVAWNAFYQPFGSTGSTVTGALTTQSLRLPGQSFDPETGYNHNGFRDYASTLTRYVETDPIGLKGGLNTYQYVGGNTFKFTDMRGLQETEVGAPYTQIQIRNAPPGTRQIMQSTNQNYGDSSTLSNLAQEISDMQTDLSDARATANQNLQDQAQQARNNTLQQIDAAKVCTNYNVTGTKKLADTPMLCGPNGCAASIQNELDATSPVPDSVMRKFLPKLQGP